MSDRLHVIAIVAIATLLILILELVRRRRLSERYALLWVVASCALLALAVWTDLLGRVSHLLGTKVPANALFVCAFAFGLVLLIHFSLSISKLSDQTRVLAQRLARAESELKQLRETTDQGGGTGAAAEQASGRRRSGQAARRRTTVS